ncbi:MAG: tRNA (N(6)-L-threonylcarbamoyladenosine(37)-C(2))-methylthiotransferase MtaB, partial [Rhodospirillales bacterium]|nr:tRNA (N(6)-L-threonylcarbamoyladenosine(37)-C(2))-methylthiotransferase MtaB [Rhodospirillales bacterium]
TLRFVADTALPYLHVFPYSERPGTPAARMPAVPKPLRRERAARLREAGTRAARDFFASQVGRTISLLTEADLSGHSEHFAPVRLSSVASPGSLLPARVTGATPEGLTADALLADAA